MTASTPTDWLRSPRSRRRMRGLSAYLFTLQTLFVLAAAAFLGIGSAWLAVEREVSFEAITIGSWTAWPTAGARKSDPYVRARFAQSGELPLNIAEGIAFTSRADSSGRPLDAACEYRIAGRIPAAQWWSLTPYLESNLGLMDNPAGRYGYDSTEVLRESDGTVVITLAPQARPGNWIPTDPGAGQIRLMLRLYDTPLSTGGRVADIDAPVIERVACP